MFNLHFYFHKNKEIRRANAAAEGFPFKQRIKTFIGGIIGQHFISNSSRV
jgi:hypothetical protein